MPHIDCSKNKRAHGKNIAEKYVVEISSNVD
jgi:hypothetical protein